MPPSKWLDRTQPQTLYIATILMYVYAVLNLLYVAVFPGILVLIAAQVLAGYGIANERKWGYWLAVAVAAALVLFTLAFFGALGIITLIFDVALVALLLHPQSRDYQRTWFH